MNSGPNPEGKHASPSPEAMAALPSSPFTSAVGGNRRAPAKAIAFLLAPALVVLSLYLLHPRAVPGSRLARASFDACFALPRSVPQWTLATSPVVIVYLDRQSYAALHQDPGQPLDRSLYARLVHRLAETGSSRVLFDILFDQPGPDPDSDAAFADALQAHGRVILGAEWHRADAVRPDDTVTQLRSLSLPAPQLLAAAAGYGFVFSRVDPDFVVRRHFPGFLDRDLPSLTWVAARQLALPVTQTGDGGEPNRWVNYYGPPLTIPGISLADALDPAAVPDEIFRGKVVLIGTRPTAGHFDERRDEWRSPLSNWGRGLLFLPAVEVHATELLNLVRGDWLRRPAPSVEAMAVALSALVIVGVLIRLRPLAAAAAVVGAEVLLLLVVALLLDRWHVWFPWLIIGAVQIPAAATGSFLLHSLTWLRQRREYLTRIREQAALIDKAQDAILVCTLDGRVTYANPRARALYGWTEGAADHGVFPPGATAGTGSDDLNPCRRIRDQGEWTGELHHHDARGQPLVIASRATLIRDERGRPRQILFINTDITEQKRLQDQFIRAQRREGIGALAGGMAHDLNNALAPILMGIQMLKAHASDDGVRQMLTTMEAQTRRGASMVRQVLLFARGKESAIDLIHASALLRELDQVLRTALPASIELTVLTPPDLWSIRANPIQIHQVLLNLCLNARDAMPAGGRLTVAADNADLDASEARELPGLIPGRHLMFLVSDTGIGMSPEVQGHLFEPFFTTKPPGVGTGLGLATTASIVKAHRGALRVRSQPGEGTSFEVYLPATLADADTNEPVPASPPAATSPGFAPGQLPQPERILVADDEHSFLEMAREGLAAQGYLIATATSGAEAVALLSREEVAPSLVIVDWRLRTLDGQILAEALRQRLPGVPQVVVDGASSDGGSPATLPPPPAGTLSKPFPIDDLVERVRRLLETVADV